MLFRLRHTAVLAGLAALFVAFSAHATEVWTPQSGSAELEDVPPDSPEARFSHACALVASEQYSSGIQMLKKLIKNHPGADFLPRARYTLGLARHGQQEYRAAFRDLQDFCSRYAEHRLFSDARALQVRCVRKVAEDDLDDALSLLDELVSTARSEKLAVKYQKLRGDLYYDAGKYLFARDEYERLARDFPQSQWVPYAFYRMALCDLKLGEWLHRGTEHISQARRTLEHFMETYPDHKLADEARKKLEKARSLEARWNAKIARFYLNDDKPTSAAVYLKKIIEDYPHFDEAKWARQELKRIREAGRLPPGMEFPEEQLSPEKEAEKDTAKTDNG